MSSSTLSAVIEKLICRLCLNDFPCGNGTWRNTKDGEERAETESTDALLDLLSCPHSPWQHDVSWSPQALPLRRLAVLAPERLHTHFIYNYFTALHIVDRGVTDIDDGLLKFSKLEELVLSANKISEIPTANLPSTLKILELRANQLSSLNTLTSCPPPPPHLQYLSLSSNTLGSHDVISHLTGRHWPQLVCLDLSDCEFQDQPALLNALSTLPCLKTLVLEGNPFTLAPSYPGLTVDSLPQLSYLDASWISPDERRHFRGLAQMSDLVVGMASATVSVGRLMGIPDPLMTVDDTAPDFPVVSYCYFITYEFLSHQTLAHLKLDTEAKSDTASTARVTDDQQSNKNCEKQTSKPDAGVLVLNYEESCCDTAYVLRHSTSKLSWSESMDFSDTQTHTVSALADLKKFLNRGLHLRLEEEKVLSWPVTSEEVLVTKPSQTVKEKKGRKEKESPVKSESKYKDKKKKSAPELLQDAPIRRILGSVHIPLQSLVRGGQQVKVLCDFGTLHTDSELEATQTHQKALGKKNKESKKKEDKEKKGRGGSGAGQQNTALSKDKGKGNKELDSVTGQLEPVTVELSVELEKWQSASEAHHFLLPHQTPRSRKLGLCCKSGFF
ncbi:leucine-rich repeat-containing protein 43 isoform X2 [Archocentrus centrarchus]|uniref:leucine-rich repeat-containing protein 43 isoform X2 n=1 Tax=Archocentrus centrarchus TaxID=63155 RepID=UPI0011EA2C9C|nr:leucine-rich repeat-containing protein 43 isoform X2 [Archocentrus centrarchus]